MSATPSSPPATGVPAPDAAPSNTVLTEWTGGLRFDATHRNARVRIDCDGPDGPGPLDAVLQALSACAASDVVVILEKQRVTLESLQIRATAHRVTTTPRRFASIALHVTARGEGLDPAKLERAVDLSVNKYCSVRDSLNPSIPITLSSEVLS